MNITTDAIHTYENLLYRNKVKTFSIYIVVLLSLFVLLISLPFIKVEVSAQARGVLRSDTEPVPINSIASARVERIYLKNNQEVAAGDTLVVLSSEGLSSERETILKNIQEQKDLLTDLELIAHKSFSQLQTVALREEYAAYRSACQELQSKVAQAKVKLNRNRQLFDKGVIALSEFETYEFTYQQLNSSLQNLQSKYFSEWSNRKITTKEKLTSLENSLTKLGTEAQNYVIKAPVAGTIEGFSGVQQGSFVLSSQNIATISPNNNLVVEAYVSPKDIGLIKKGQLVRVQVDAFNYNQWGTLTGKVLDIDNNVTQHNSDIFFKVRCLLEDNSLSLKNGYKAAISKGMTLTARFIIARRSLYQLLFDKVDNWLNPAQSLKT